MESAEGRTKGHRRVFSLDLSAFGSWARNFMDLRDVQWSAAKAVRVRALGALNKTVNDWFGLQADDGRTQKQGFPNGSPIEGGRHTVTVRR